MGQYRGSKKGRGQGLPGPMDVVQGRATADAATFLSMIREVNPTGLSLPHEEAQRRYELKSRLQSLLVRRFPEEVTVRREPGAPDLILIQRKRDGRSAGHTFLSALDDDARAWVLRELDQDAAPRAGTPAPDDAPPQAARSQIRYRGTAEKEAPRQAMRGPREDLALRARSTPAIADVAHRARSTPAIADVAHRARCTPAIADERVPEDGPAHPGASPEQMHSARALVQLGHKAQEAFDYDTARACFVRALAVATPRGQARAALALLTLLVDHLADDEQALALGEELPEEARSAEVRLLLGLAAARCGQDEQAEHFVRDLSQRRVSEVLVVLARGALRDGDLPRAERWLAEAREHDPADPGVHDLAAQVLDLRAQERLPAEQELSRLLAGGDVQAAEAEARRLLARWPESEIGRRTLHALSMKRRTEEARACLQAGEEALGGGRRALALVHFHRGLDTGVGGDLRAELLSRLTEAEQAERAESDAARVEEVRGLLARADLASGLLGYLALKPAQKHRVREQIEVPHCAWLEEMMAARPGAPARALVEAACALGRAHELVPVDPEAALGLLGEHERLLEPLGQARRLAAEARGLLAQRRREQARGRLEAARAALSAARPADELAHAQALVEAADLHLLADEEQAAAQALLGELREALGRLRLEASFHQLLEAGALFGARDAAERLHRLSSGADKERWQAARADVVLRIRRNFRVWVSHAPGPGDELRDVGIAPDRFPGRWLLADGGHLVVASTRGRWVFVSLSDLSGTVRTRVMLTTPAPFRLETGEADESGIWLLGKEGAVILLSLPNFDVVRFHKRGDLTGRGDRVAAMQLGPGSRFLWLALTGKDAHWEQARVIDLDHPHLVRTMGQMLRSYPITAGPAGPYMGEQVVVAQRRYEEVLLFSPRGTELRHIRLPARSWLRGAAPHPAGAGLLLLVVPRKSQEQEDKEGISPLCYQQIRDGDEVAPPEPVAGSNGSGACGVATAQEARMAFIRFYNQQGGAELLALQASAEAGGRLETAYRIDLPRGAALVRDVASRRAVLLTQTGSGFQTVELGREPPVLPPAPERDRVCRDPLVVNACWPRSPRAQEAPEFKGFDDRSPARRAQLARSFFGRLEGEPSLLLDITSALESRGHHAEAEELAVEVHGQKPQLLAARLRVAQNEAWKGRWGAVLDLLGGAPAEAGALLEIGAGRVRHWHHLLGMALLHAGEQARALEVLGEGLQHQGACKLDPFIALATPLSEPLAPVADQNAAGDPHLLRRLAGWIAEADACLERGDAEGAWRVMDQPEVWIEWEIQSLARLAEAGLGAQPADEAMRFRELVALATFHQAHHAAVGSRREMPVARAWDRARLDELATRAQARLEEPGP